MKLFWLLLCCIATSYAGVVPWSQDKEDEAVKLFMKFCSSAVAGRKPTTGKTPDGARWDCKIQSDSAPVVTFEHKENINIPSAKSKQIIFIQTPDKKFKHNVHVQGEAEFNHDTDIYVVPGLDRHDVDITADITTKQGEGGKPRTLFLKNNPIGGGNNGGGGGGHGGGGDGGSSYPATSPSFNPSYNPGGDDDDKPSNSPSYNYGNSRHRRKLAVKVKKVAPTPRDDDDESEEVVEVTRRVKSGNRRHRRKSISNKKPEKVVAVEPQEDEESEEADEVEEAAASAAASTTVNKFAGFGDFQPFQF